MALSASSKKILIFSFSCAVYLALGTVIFVAIEGDNTDEAAVAKQELERQILKNNTMIRLNMSSDEYDALYEEILQVSTDNTAPKWDYWRGFSFVVQVVTTIGYGNLTPSTTAGRVLCIFYALFGIPLYVLFLQAIGNELVRAQRKLLIRIETCVRGGQNEPRYLNEKCAAVTFALVMVVVFSGAGIQTRTEKWTFLEGVYCYFITFTTIGFGDLIPGGRGHSTIRTISPFYTLFGLVVMANMVNALVGCGDTFKALNRLLKCDRGNIDLEVEAKEENISMEKQNDGNEEKL